MIDAKYLLKEANEHFAEVLYGTFMADRTDEKDGLCITVYQAQQNYPKAVRADKNGISVMLVPEGVGDKAGYIRIESEGADVEVKGIVMFYKQGVFLQEFTDEELKLGVSSGNLTQNKSALYNPENRPANDMNPVNPDYFIYFKNASIPVSTSTGNHGAYLRFSTYEHIKKILATNTEISNSTLIKNVAMQVDVYMPKSLE